jgi:flavodoxin
MRALVVYESMFGNTHEIAEAVAEGLSRHLPVELREVNALPQPRIDDQMLVVVGGPTHGFSLSRASTRADAIRQGASHGSQPSGLREWLARLPNGSSDQYFAVFDTRVDRVRRLPGSAAKKAARILERLGYTVVGRQSFYVADTPGPLLPDELGRAGRWGSEVGADVIARTASRTSGSSQVTEKDPQR